MHALLAVGQGSHNPPCLVALRYNGNGDAPYTAFVGKGITFDSGGISIKPDDNMGEMKDDMTGAGAVLGAMRAIARLGLKCNVIGVLACAENMPDGKAQRPGDIVRAANGKPSRLFPPMRKDAWCWRTQSGMPAKWVPRRLSTSQR